MTVASGLGAVHALRVFQAAVSDDAFILYRYARHLARGEGLVWNIGQPPIEGFTSLLHVLLLALGSALGADLVLLGQVYGVLFAALACIVAAWLGWETTGGRDGRVAVLAAFGLAISPPLAAWARGGMETTLFTFVLSLAVAMWMRENRLKRDRWWTSVTFFVAILARPEALGFAAAAFVLDLLTADRGRLRGWWTLGVALTALGTWKVLYFGDVLPNTYYAKTGGGWWAFTEGIKYVLRFLWMYGTINTLFALVPAISLMRRNNIRILYLLVCLFGLCLHVARVGGDYQYFGRYLVPALPWLMVLTISGFLVVLDSTAGQSPWRRLGVLAIAIVAVLQLTLPSLREIADRPWLLARPLRLVNDTDPELFRFDFREMGLALREITAPDETVAALAVGAIGYYSERPILDCLGLNDREIARLPTARDGRSKWHAGHMRGNAESVLTRRPDLIVAPIRPTDQPCAEPSRKETAVYTFVEDLLSDPDFQRNYELRSRPLAGGRWLNYWTPTSRSSSGPAEMRCTRRVSPSPNGSSGR